MTISLPGRALAVTLLAGAALAMAGCGSGTPTAAAPTAEPAVVTAPGPAPSSGTVDACGLASAAEITTLIGTNPGPKQTGAGNCTWENPTTYESVTIEIGRPGSAPGGRIPPWDPAFGEERVVGDGMRDINGAIEFAAGTRDCTVQVATTDFDKNRTAGLALVAKVRSQVS